MGIYIKLLKVLKRIYLLLNPDSSRFGRNWKMFPLKNYSNELIYKLLLEDKPLMIGRLGANELALMVNYLCVKNPELYKSQINYIKNLSPSWWWDKNVLQQMQQVAGFFPNDLNKFGEFCELMINELPNVDILGSWLKEESFFADQLVNAKKVMLEDLEPFFSSNPWTKALANKKVLVVHSFAETIESQYIKREKLFENDMLPEFQLITLKAIQSAANEKTNFKDWFEALDWMTEKIKEIDFDICILSCGAYGFPLAARVKRMGKKSIHLGGVTQLLFGIKGKRWENHIVYPYSNLFNEYWVRPNNNEKPQNANLMEGATYW